MYRAEYMLGYIPAVGKDFFVSLRKKNMFFNFLLAFLVETKTFLSLQDQHLFRDENSDHTQRSSRIRRSATMTSNNTIEYINIICISNL